MRIAQIATLATPVRRNGAGSIEGMVWLLAREMSRQGHEVTVFCTAGSDADGEIITTLPGPYGINGSLDEWHLCEWINISRAVELSGRFDILHSHAYLWGIPLSPLSRSPMVHTTHVLPGIDEMRLWEMYPDAAVTAISEYQWSNIPVRQKPPVIHHGVDAGQFTFRAEPDDYLCFLGRFTPGKGPLTAIAAAKNLGLRIFLAGPRNEFYDRHVEPLVDGEEVIYVGGIGGAERDRLLGGARALLYPIRDPEPFGLVLPEAMMCGTPVAAIGIGAVPEIIDEGITGCSAPSAEEFTDAVRGALTLEREQVRRQAVYRFSAEQMAHRYVRIYSSLLSGEFPP